MKKANLKASGALISCLKVFELIDKIFEGMCIVSAATAVEIPYFLLMEAFRVSIRIARPGNALWRAILRWAILSTSFIRIARPIYFVFLVLI